MVYLPTESLDLMLTLGYMASNLLFLTFFTLYSSSLWRTDTIVPSKLNKPPPPSNKPFVSTNPPPDIPSNELEINKPSGGKGLMEDLR